MQAVEVLKEQGNNAFKAQQYPQALELYSHALQLDPQNYILYSNRSAVHIQLKNYELALSDADMVSRFACKNFNSALERLTEPIMCCARKIYYGSIRHNSGTRD